MTAAVNLAHVTARSPRRDAVRAGLNNISFTHAASEKSALTILGAAKDGTSLLFDVIEGRVAPKTGHVHVHGGLPEAARPRMARVSFEAPLPDALRVEEVCALAADLRGDPQKPAAERLSILGIGALAKDVCAR